VAPPAAAILVAAGAFGVAAPTASAAVRPCADTSGCAGWSLSDNGYGARAAVSWWGMYPGHDCTNYVAYMMATAGVATPGYRLGNAESWGPAAAAHGVPVDGQPSVGAVAWWSSGAGGVSLAGHVAYVQTVTPTSITISEDSYPSGPFDHRVVERSSASWPTGFIHFLRGPASGVSAWTSQPPTALSSGLTELATKEPATRLGPQRPGVARDPSGRVTVAAVGADRSLVVSSRTAIRGSWQTTVVTAPGAVASAPSVVAGSAGFAAVAITGPHGELLVYGRADAASGWTLEQVAGAHSVVGAPSAVLQDGVLEVAARGPAGGLVLYSARVAPAAPVAGHGEQPAAVSAPPRTRTWSAATVGGAGSATSDPALAASGHGPVEIAVVGPAHSLVLHTGTPTGAWIARRVEGPGTAFGVPALLVGPGSTSTIATLGQAGSVEVHTGRVTSGGWTTHRVAGPGSAVVSPVLVASRGGVAVAVRRPRGALTLYTPTAAHRSAHSGTTAWSTTSVTPAEPDAASGPAPAPVPLSAPAALSTPALSTPALSTPALSTPALSKPAPAQVLPAVAQAGAGVRPAAALTGAEIISVDAAGMLSVATATATGSWTVTAPTA